MTALGETIRTMIESEGPMPLDRFMELCLTHPEHGYYSARDPLGAGGDFVTAPEISQMFGELVGLWAAETWARMGSPKAVRLVELGPGRGTMMADALRACRVAPAFLDAITEIDLVETSAHLRERQEEKLGRRGKPVVWRDQLSDVPEGPAIVLANEFLDALPVRHFVKVEEGWCEKLVGIDENGVFFFGLSPQPETLIHAEAPVGAVLEIGAASHKLTAELASRIVAHGGAALIIDYGHVTTSLGETLQALRRHEAIDPLADPGECDLTAHVDFASLGRAAHAVGAAVWGPITQGEFLRSLGIVQRAEALKRNASALQAITIGRELARLTATEEERGASGRMVPGMGDLFKVMAITQPDCPAPPSFEDQGHAPAQVQGQGREHDD